MTLKRHFLHVHNPPRNRCTQMHKPGQDMNRKRLLGGFRVELQKLESQEHLQRESSFAHCKILRVGYAPQTAERLVRKTFHTHRLCRMLCTNCGAGSMCSCNRGNDHETFKTTKGGPSLSVAHTLHAHETLRQYIVLPRQVRSVRDKIISCQSKCKGMQRRYDPFCAQLT